MVVVGMAEDMVDMVVDGEVRMEDVVVVGHPKKKPSIMAVAVVDMAEDMVAAVGMVEDMVAVVDMEEDMVARVGMVADMAAEVDMVEDMVEVAAVGLRKTKPIST